MIFPYAHEQMVARRWPMLTTVFVVLNVLCLIALWRADASHRDDVLEAAHAVQEYWAEHPSLEAPAALRDAGLDDELRPTTTKAPPSAGYFPTAPSVEETDELARLSVAFLERVKNAPARRFGYVPSENNVLGLFTYSLLHDGVLHLVGNMWFLWLCACNLEDRWGRPIFFLFYTAAGVVAGLAHMLFAPSSTIPLVGASGAIAGAMGAFLVLYARTSIRFAYLFFLGFRFKAGTFAAPAWLMLPLWLLEQVFWMLMTPRDGGGVAYMAHIGGFAFGAAIAGLMLVTGLDKKLDDAMDDAVTTGQDPRLAAASAMLDRGDTAGAVRAFEAIVGTDPSNIDAYLELLRASKAAGDERRESIAYGRLIDLYRRDGHLGTATDLYGEVDRLGRVASLPLATRMRLADALATAKDHERALQVYSAVVGGGIHDVITATAAVGYAKLLFATGRTDRARQALVAATQSGMVPSDLRASVDDLMQQMQHTERRALDV